MAANQRVKGQEVRVTFTGPSGTIPALDNIKSFELGVKLEILSEGYLGGTSELKDDIFKGVSGRMEIHIASKQYFAFVKQVKERSQRRIASDIQFNATCVVALPNGERPRLLVSDLFFGELPLNVGGRDEYVSATIEFEASEISFFNV